MPKYTRSEFAKELKRTIAYVTVNVKRGKILVGGDDLIDTDLEINQAFLEKVQSKVKYKPVDKPKPIPKPKPIKQEERTKEQAEIDFDNMSLSALDREKRELEVALKRKDLELKNMEIAKKMGEVVPVDLVKGLITRLGKNYVSTFKDGTDKLLIEMLAKLGANRQESSSMRGKFLELINNCIDETLELTDLEMESIINDYKTIR